MNYAPYGNGNAPHTEAFTDYAERYLTAHLAHMRALPIEPIVQAVDIIWEAHEREATIFICGNGGSASMAAHFAADLCKTTMPPDCFSQARRFRVVSLVENMALLTAWSNDTTYEQALAEQLRNLARPGDLLIAISGSGNSPNIVAALEAAATLGVRTIGLTGGTGGRLHSDATVCITAATDAYEHNEPLHSMIFHMITFYLRERLMAQVQATMSAAGMPLPQQPAASEVV